MKGPTALARWRLELVVVAAGAVILGFLAWHGIRVGKPAFERVVATMLGRWPSLLLVGALLQLAARLLRRQSPLEWARGYLAPGSLVDALRAWLALGAMTCLYFWLKISVPLVRRPVWDAELWSLDRWVHLGVSPSILAVELFSGSWLVTWVDYWYALWLTTVLATQAFVLFDPVRERRLHFALSCVVLWLSAAWVYVLVPAVGPCYFVPDVFASVREAMPGARMIQQSLWSNYLDVVASRGSGVDVPANPFLAVAALPSVHVGAHFLFTLWARRHAPRLVPVFAIATALTFVGSLLTGWHYAVDGYLGLVLGWVAIRVADLGIPVDGRRSDPEIDASASDGDRDDDEVAFPGG